MRGWPCSSEGKYTSRRALGRTAAPCCYTAAPSRATSSVPMKPTLRPLDHPRVGGRCRGAGAGRRKYRERSSNGDCGSRIPQVGVSNAIERGARVAFAEPQTAQRSKGLRVSIRGSWVRHASVGRAVGVLKAEPGRDPPLDDQLPAVLCPMMRGAKNDQAVLTVVPTFRA